MSGGTSSSWPAWLSGAGALASAIAAIIAVTYSVNVHKAARRRSIPTERPIITITDSKSTGILNIKDEVLKINLRIMLKNIGTHPADKFRMRVWTAPLNRPEQFVKSHDSNSANVFYPENIVTWTPTLSVPFKRDGERIEAKKAKMFFYIHLAYNDGFHVTKNYDNDIYLVYETGSGSIGSATVKVKEVFQEYLDEIK
jgi:hypothetical protein